MGKEKVKIEFDEWIYDCADGCCTTHGLTTKVNGVEMDFFNEDVATVTEMILTHLGYDVEIIETYNGE